jgi:hypothetical protein
MPLLESRESRNRRLLNEAVAGLLQAMAGLAPEEAAYKTHSSWVCGGSVTAALAVTDVDALKRLWGKGDERRALALLEVFTYPMISRWYRTRERQLQVAPAHKELARRIAASNISAVFGSRSEQLVDDFIKMDIQFSYERDWIEDQARSGIPVMEAHLLLSKALQAWGYPSRLDWSRITFPVRDIFQLAEQGQDLDSASLRDIFTINSALLDGETAMYVYYRSL